MDELLLLIQKSYGLVGVILFLPVFATIHLARENRTLQLAVVKATEQATEAQKQRVADSQAISTQLINVLKEQAALNTETNIGLERIVDVLSELQTRIVDNPQRRTAVRDPQDQKKG